MELYVPLRVLITKQSGFNKCINVATFSGLWYVVLKTLYALYGVSLKPLRPINHNIFSTTVT